MNSTIFDDGSITVTEREVKTKGFTLYIDSISSISISTVRPAKWAAVTSAIPIFIGIVAMMGLVWMFSPNRRLLSLLLPITFIPMVAIQVGGFLMRFSRLSLQTTGGPVQLASDVSFSEPHETLERYKAIKAAIEQAIAMSKTRSGPIAR